LELPCSWQQESPSPETLAATNLLEKNAAVFFFPKQKNINSNAIEIQRRTILRHRFPLPVPIPVPSLMPNNTTGYADIAIPGSDGN